MSKRPTSVPSSIVTEPLSRASFLRLMFGAAGVLGGLAFVGTSCAPDDGRVPDASSGDGSDAGGSGPDAGEDVESDAGDEIEADAGEDVADAGDEVDAGEDPTCTTPTTTIGSNHGHTLVVPIADVNAGEEQTYDIEGSSGHVHLVTLTAAHFAQLAEGTPVTVTSTSGGGHSHSVTVRCSS